MVGVPEAVSLAASFTSLAAFFFLLRLFFSCVLPFTTTFFTFATFFLTLVVSARGTATSEMSVTVDWSTISTPRLPSLAVSMSTALALASSRDSVNF